MNHTNTLVLTTVKKVAVLTLCTLCMMRVLLLVCVGPTLFLASNSFRAESVTTSPPFVNCSEKANEFTSINGKPGKVK